jgi:RND family efflux transporter MFP subunit
MQKIKLIAALGLLIIFSSCGDKKNESDKVLSEKKAKLEKLITQQSSLQVEIDKLQEEIKSLSGNSDNAAQAKLVAITPVAVEKFSHFIDLRGRVDAEDISYISPRGMGGQVKELYIKEGDVVKKGQLLLRLDDAIMRQSLVAARQQIEGIKTQLKFSKDVFERQNNLWKKGIGTEIQLLNAKTNMETLENQLKSANEQINVVQEQLNTTAVYSDVDGVAETVMIKVGELFGGMGQIKIVNTDKLKVVSNVPENYINKVHKGIPVVISIPDANETINSTISLIGQTIENTQRGFIAEAKIPTSNFLKPNQSVIMKILDYINEKAVVISINTVQSDEKSKYVYVLEKNGKGVSVAVKKIIVLGETYGDLVEIKSGLSGGEQLITAGYQNLYEGQTINTSSK